MKGIGQLIGFFLFVLPRIAWNMLTGDSKVQASEQPKVATCAICGKEIQWTPQKGWIHTEYPTPRDHEARPAEKGQSNAE